MASFRKCIPCGGKRQYRSTWLPSIPLERQFFKVQLAKEEPRQEDKEEDVIDANVYRQEGEEGMVEVEPRNWQGKKDMTNTKVLPRGSFSELANPLMSTFDRRLLYQLQLEMEKMRLEREMAILHTLKKRLLEEVSEIQKVKEKIVWKFSEVKQKIFDAEKEKQIVIQSQPFFLERLHYKGFLKLGKGVGKESHISLFFGIMKGEFDDDLQWPFTGKITITLVNQTGGKDKISTFQLEAIKKPETDEGFASGCIFISQADLKCGGFIDDDTLFIQCEVNAATD